MEPNQLHDLSVLITDDEPEMIDLIGNTVEKQIAKIFTATDGSDALGIIKSNDIDIAILDIFMPGINGLDLLLSAKKFRPGIVIVILSGFTNTNTLIKAIRHEAFDFISKPFENDDLEHCLMRCIDKAKMTKALNQILQLLLYQISNISSSEFNGLPLNEKEKILESLLGIVKSKVVNINERSSA